MKNLMFVLVALLGCFGADTATACDKQFVVAAPLVAQYSAPFVAAPFVAAPVVQYSAPVVAPFVVQQPFLLQQRVVAAPVVVKQRVVAQPVQRQVVRQRTVIRR